MHEQSSKRSLRSGIHVCELMSITMLYTNATTGHMRILWSIIGTIVGAILLSILLQQLRPVHGDHKNMHALDFASREQILNAPIPDMAKDVIMDPVKRQLDVRIHSSSVSPGAGAADDHRLRAFDEF